MADRADCPSWTRRFHKVGAASALSKATTLVYPDEDDDASDDEPVDWRHDEASCADGGCGVPVTAYTSPASPAAVFASTSSGDWVHLAGALGQNNAGHGFVDGPCTIARFNHPAAATVATREIFVADTYNHAVRRLLLDSSGNVQSVSTMDILSDTR